MANDRTAPEGLLYQPDFLDQEEEAELLRVVDAVELHEVRMHGVAAKRTTAHFGFSYSYEGHGVQETAPIPEPFLPLRGRIAAVAGVPAEALAELLVTRYPAGAGIGWHRDAPVFGIVAGVSLLSDTVFRFRRKVGDGWQRFDLTAERRSLYLLTGASRNAWQHGITAVPALRWSLTFRTVRSQRR